MENTTPVTPTPASEWQSSARMEGHDLPLPSGNVARIRQIAPTAFLTQGLIPDPLTDIIRKAIHTSKGLNPKDLDVIQEDPAMLGAALRMFDEVLCYVAVQPKITMPPPCDVAVDDGVCGLYANEDVHKNTSRSGHHQYNEGERDPSVLYADIVDMDDKTFIFQWCLGGTQDLATFREEQARNMESLQNGEDVEVPA